MTGRRRRSEFADPWGLLKIKAGRADGPRRSLLAIRTQYVRVRIYTHKEGRKSAFDARLRRSERKGQKRSGMGSSFHPYTYIRTGEKGRVLVEKER